MKKIALLCLGAMFAASTSLGIPGLSKADPAYSANDFIEFFAKDKAELEAHEVKRTVCFGSNDPDPDCAPVKPKSRDLRVNFQFGSAILTPDAKETLTQFAIALKNSKLVEARFEIDGHTDASGRGDYNLDLSKRRAQAVVSFLRDKGIDQKRLDAIGFGQSQPAVPDPFAPANRRVEAHLAQ